MSCVDDRVNSLDRGRADEAFVAPPSDSSRFTSLCFKAYKEYVIHSPLRNCHDHAVRRCQWPPTNFPLRDTGQTTEWESVDFAEEVGSKTCTPFV